MVNRLLRFGWQAADRPAAHLILSLSLSPTTAETVPLLVLPLGSLAKAIAHLPLTPAADQCCRVLPVEKAADLDFAEIIQQFGELLRMEARRRITRRFDVVIGLESLDQSHLIEPLLERLETHLDWPVRVFVFLGVAEMAWPLKASNESSDLASQLDRLTALQRCWSSGRIKWAATMLVGGPTPHGLFPKMALPRLLRRIFQLSFASGLLNWLANSPAIPRKMEDFFASAGSRIALLGIGSIAAPDSWSEFAGSLHALRLATHYNAGAASHQAESVDLRSVLDAFRIFHSQRFVRSLVGEARSWLCDPGNLHDRSRRLVERVASPTELLSRWNLTIDHRMQKLTDRVSEHLDQAGNQLVLTGRGAVFLAMLGEAADQLRYLRESCSAWCEALLAPLAAAEAICEDLLGCGNPPSARTLSNFYPLGLWRLSCWRNRFEAAALRWFEHRAELQVATATIVTIADIEKRLQTVRESLWRFNAELVATESLLRDEVARHLKPELPCDVAVSTVDTAISDWFEIAGPVTSLPPLASTSTTPWHKFTRHELQLAVAQHANAFVASHNDLIAPLRDRCLATRFANNRLVDLARVELPGDACHVDREIHWLVDRKDAKTLASLATLTLPIS